MKWKIDKFDEMWLLKNIFVLLWYLNTVFSWSVFSEYVCGLEIWLNFPWYFQDYEHLTTTRQRSATDVIDDEDDDDANNPSEAPNYRYTKYKRGVSSRSVKSESHIERDLKPTEREKKKVSRGTHEETRIFTIN